MVGVPEITPVAAHAQAGRQARRRVTERRAAGIRATDLQRDDRLGDGVLWLPGLATDTVIHRRRGRAQRRGQRRGDHRAQPGRHVVVGGGRIQTVRAGRGPVSPELSERVVIGQGRRPPWARRRRDIAELGQIGRARQRVQRRVHEPDREAATCRAGVRQRGECRPQRRGGAGAAGHAPLAAGVDGVAGQAIGVSRHVRHLPALGRATRLGRRPRVEHSHASGCGKLLVARDRPFVRYTAATATTGVEAVGADLLTATTAFRIGAVVPYRLGGRRPVVIRSVGRLTIAGRHLNRLVPPTPVANG